MRLRLADKFVIMLALSVVLYLWMVWRADGEKVLAALAGMPLWGLPAVLGLVLTGYFFRFLKWEYCLRELEIPVPPGRSLRIFVSGMAMTITPGKVGEVLKSFLLRESQGVPMAASSPIVFAERLGDLCGVMLLALGGYLWYDADPRQAAAGVGVLLAAIALLTWRRLAMSVLTRLDGMPMIGRSAHTIREFYESSYRLLKPRPFAIITLLSILGWGCECLGLYVTGISLGFSGLTPARACFVFAAGTLAGVITPGGLGVTDGLMLTLLERDGMSRALASSATLLIRACTLWFGVLLGGSVLLASRVRPGRLDSLSGATESLENDSK